MRLLHVGVRVTMHSGKIKKKYIIDKKLIINKINCVIKMIDLLK